MTIKAFLFTELKHRLTFAHVQKHKTKLIKNFTVRIAKETCWVLVIGSGQLLLLNSVNICYRKFVVKVIPNLTKS